MSDESADNPQSAQPREPGAASPDSPADLLTRIDATTRRAFVYDAVNRLAPGAKKGSRSGVWSLTIGQLFDIAALNIIENKSVAAIGKLRTQELRRANVSLKQLERWLPTVRAKYNDISAEFFSRQTSRVLSFSTRGDLMQLAELLDGIVASEIIAELQAHGMASMSTGERHVILRFVETLNVAAKMQAESRLKNLQADKLKAALDKAKGAGTDSEGRKVYTAEDVIELVHGVVAGKEAA